MSSFFCRYPFYASVVVCCLVLFLPAIDLSRNGKQKESGFLSARTIHRLTSPNSPSLLLHLHRQKNRRLAAAMYRVRRGERHQLGARSVSSLTASPS